MEGSTKKYRQNPRRICYKKRVVSCFFEIKPKHKFADL